MIDTDQKFLENLKNKTLLIIASAYSNENESFIDGIFVKNQVAELKKYFKKVIIIAPVFRSFGWLKKERLCTDYSYENVEVYYPRCFYIPIFWLSKIVIDNRLHIVEQTIETHHLHFDLIHAHFTWPSGYIGVRLKEKFRKPVVITIHENGEWLDQEIEMDHPFINVAWSNADAIIRVNSKDIHLLQQYNEQVYAIPNGFSKDFHPINSMDAKDSLSLSGDKKIIFTLGHLIKRKGFNYLIDAMEKICRKRDDVLCYIGGDGSEWGSLQGHIDMLHLGEKVKLLGSVPQDKLTLWMNAADLFVLPSLNEGNPTVMFEVLGCGKPFVGTRVGGVPEVISSDKYGLLVDAGDPSDLAEKILLALDHKWDRNEIITYSERYTWENIARAIVDVYLQVL